MGLFYFLFFTPLFFNYSPYLLVSIIIVSRFVRVFPIREYSTCSLDFYYIYESSKVT